MKRIVQFSVDVAIDEDTYQAFTQMEHEECMIEGLEDSGFDVRGVSLLTSWTEKEYKEGVK